MSIPGWQETLREKVIPGVIGDAVWEVLLTEAISSDSHPSGIHLAVFSEPFLSYVMEGKKRIDSRFSTRRVAPYEKIAEGDIVLIKASGGPIKALSQVGKVWFYKMGRDSWAKLKEKYAEALCAMDPVFWEERREATYATLLQLRVIKTIEPVFIKKRDRRSWAVLRSTIGVNGLEIG